MLYVGQALPKTGRVFYYAAGHCTEKARKRYA